MSSGKWTGIYGKGMGDAVQSTNKAVESSLAEA